MSALAPTLQSFFASYLHGQRAASRHTITAYRDTFRLLLGYVQEQTGVRPSDVDIAMLDAELVGEFLTMLEQRRGNSARTRNARLAAIHSLFSHAALRHPEHAELIAQVLAIPFKRGQQTVVSYLDNAEVEALLAAPDRATRSGRRDHLLLLLMISTGLRVSEVTALVRADVSTDRRLACVSCTGKGRKQRVTPIDRPLAAALKAWLAENTGDPPPRCSPHRGPAIRSAPTRSPSGSDCTHPQRLRPARRWPRRTSRPTSFATPAPCDCWPQASGPPRSPCSSVTSRWHPPAPTSTPTSNSNSAPSTAPPHRGR